MMRKKIKVCIRVFVLKATPLLSQLSEMMKITANHSFVSSKILLLKSSYVAFYFVEQSRMQNKATPFSAAKQFIFGSCVLIKHINRYAFYSPTKNLTVPIFLRSEDVGRREVLRSFYQVQAVQQRRQTPSSPILRQT